MIKFSTCRSLWIYKYSAILLLSVFFTSCKREVYTGAVESQSIQNGKVVIRTLPEGADIYLNGKNMGVKTPDSLTWLSTGNYNVTLKLNLFPDKKFTITLNNGEKSQLYYNYFDDPNNFGAINCKSTPSNADIVLNDSATGHQTPAILNQLFPGQYKIKLNLAGCRSDSSIVIVTGGKTQNVNVFLDDTTKWVSYKVTNSPMPTNYLSSVVVDHNNVKWFGTLDKGIAGFNGRNWQLYSTKNSPLVYDFINCLMVDKDNVLWIGSSGGLLTLNGSIWTDYSSRLPSKFVTAIIADKNNVVWIGTQNGLVKYDGSTWKTFTTDNSGITANFVTSLAVDNNSNKLWIGSNAYGISMFDGSNWKVYNMANMQLGVKVGNSIQDIAVDKDGFVYAAHIQNTITGDTGGLTMFDGTAWSVIAISGIPTDFTESIYVDQNNYKWIGTKGGLARYKFPNDVSLFTTINSKLPASQVEATVIDAAGDLWVGTFGGGAAKLKKGNF